jgi:pilus assembly protein CpaB
MARTVAGAAPGRTNRRFLIIAILFASLSGALFYAWMASQSGDSSGSGGSGAAGSQKVVVAKTVIKQRTEITADMLEVKSIPVNAVVGGGFTTLADVVGRTAKLPIEANQQVVLSSVVDTTGAADTLANVVPNLRRAYAITASESTTAGGLILPGDYVDIYWICCKGTPILAKTVVQNIQVAAIAQNIVDAGPVGSSDGTGVEGDPVSAGQGEQNPEASTITLLVTPEQAHLLLLAEQSGPLHAALRGVNDAIIAPDTELFTSTLKLLPLEVLQTLPRELWPEGYAPQ